MSVCLTCQSVPSYGWFDVVRMENNLQEKIRANGCSCSQADEITSSSQKMLASPARLKW